MQIEAAEQLTFLGKKFELASYNHKASAMWEFTTGGENVNNWTTLLTVLERPEAKTMPDLDRLAQGIVNTYTAQHGKIMLAKTMQGPKGVFNYIMVAFEQPAHQRYELNFVKLALVNQKAIVTVYGVRVPFAEAKAFVNANSQVIGQGLELMAEPQTAAWPRKEF